MTYNDKSIRICSSALIKLPESALQSCHHTIHVCLMQGSTGEEKHIKIVCSEACTVYFHFPQCFRAFEREFKKHHPNFALKVRLK